MVALTLPELEKWMVLAVASCHGSRHGTLGQTPAAMWAAGVVATGIPAVTANQTSFLVDFLPVVRRTLTRTGFRHRLSRRKGVQGPLYQTKSTTKSHKPGSR